MKKTVSEQTQSLRILQQAVSQNTFSPVDHLTGFSILTVGAALTTHMGVEMRMPATGTLGIDNILHFSKKSIKIQSFFKMQLPIIQSAHPAEKINSLPIIF